MQVDEISEDIFRINLEVPRRPLTYSFFLVRDDAPTLIETSFRSVFAEAREAVESLIDLDALRYIVVPHLEADECGALNPFLAVAPNAVPVCSPIGRSSITDLADREPHVVNETDQLELGDRRLKFLLTPYVHQWDSLLAFEETTGTLFSSDLFIERGGTGAVTDRDLSEQMVDAYRNSGIMPSKAHLDAALDKVEAVAPSTLACHHGTVKSGHVEAYLKALRETDVTGIVRTGLPMSEPTDSDAAER